MLRPDPAARRPQKKSERRGRPVIWHRPWRLLFSAARPEPVNLRSGGWRRPGLTPLPARKRIRTDKPAIGWWQVQCRGIASGQRRSFMESNQSFAAPAIAAPTFSPITVERFGKSVAGIRLSDFPEIESLRRRERDLWKWLSNRAESDWW